MNPAKNTPYGKMISPVIPFSSSSSKDCFIAMSGFQAG
jgi:hypothetical protein